MNGHATKPQMHPTHIQVKLHHLQKKQTFSQKNVHIVVSLAVAPTVELPGLMVVVDDTLVITPTVITLGVPEANIMWSKNGVSLDPDSNPRVSINNVTGVLTMTGFGSEDRGDYAITLHNQAGPASDTIPVTTYCEFNVKCLSEGD